MQTMNKMEMRTTTIEATPQWTTCGAIEDNMATKTTANEDVNATSNSYNDKHI